MNNPPRKKCGPRLAAWLVCAGLFAMGAPAFAQDAAAPMDTLKAEDKTPAEWVAQLGADHLADRDEASAALLALGAAARDDVRAALRSQDPEIRARARKLWATLRWDVVLGAEKDIAKFLNPAAQPQDMQKLWDDFRKKYGMQTLRLIAEFHAGEMEQTGYQNGLLLLLANTPFGDAVHFIGSAEPGDQQAYGQLLDLFRPGANGLTFACTIVSLRAATGDYEKAFDYGRDSAVALPWTGPDYDKLVASAADAAKQGGLLNNIQQTAPADLAAETDADTLCAKLAFYSALMAQLGKKAAIDPLCDAAAGRTAAADDDHLRRLAETLLAVDMPARALKALDGATGILALYMRSSIELKAGDKSAAEADWNAALKAADAAQDEQKKESWLNLGSLMHQWHDDRAETILQKVLASPPEKTGYDVLACFELGALMEEQRQNARAIEFYEKGLDLCNALGGRYSTSSPDHHSVRVYMLDVNAADVRGKLKKLKEQPAQPTPAPGASPKDKKDHGSSDGDINIS